jgi:hypothetical protein
VRRQIRCVLGVVAFIAAAPLGCEDQSEVAREARRVFVDATRSGSGACWADISNHTRKAFERSCELSFTGDWTEYKRSIRSRMGRQYHVRAETNELLSFSRALDGDLYTVTFALFTDTAKKSVRITFRAAPW